MGFWSPVRCLIQYTHIDVQVNGFQVLSEGVSENPQLYGDAVMSPSQMKPVRPDPDGI